MSNTGILSTRHDISVPTAGEASGAAAILIIDLPQAGSSSIADAHFSCPTCLDEGLPGRVLVLHDDTNSATVLMAQGQQEVALDLVQGVKVGDYVLVHLATAIALLNSTDVSEGE